jgi:hypothetical protein
MQEDPNSELNVLIRKRIEAKQLLHGIQRQIGELKLKLNNVSQDLHGIQTRRMELIRSDPNYVTVFTVFERIGKPFLNLADIALRFWPYRYSYCGEFLIIPVVEGMWDPENQRTNQDDVMTMVISHRKLVALWKLDWWLRKNHDRMLAYLYRPEGAFAKRAEERFDRTKSDGASPLR